MRTVGDRDAGYSVSYDSPSRTVHVVGWGFWSNEVAGSFGTVALEALRDAPGRSYLVLDMTQLKPLRDEGQDSWGALMSGLAEIAPAGVRVLTASPLTKLQLLRIGRERGALGLVEFAAADSGMTRRETR